MEQNGMKFCQSCGMPMGEEALYGTNADGSKNGDYCRYCFEKGAFTFDGGMEEMVEFCVPKMAGRPARPCGSGSRPSSAGKSKRRPDRKHAPLDGLKSRPAGRVAAKVDPARPIVDGALPPHGGALKKRTQADMRGTGAGALPTKVISNWPHVVRLVLDGLLTPRVQAGRRCRSGSRPGRGRPPRVRPGRRGRRQRACGGRS